MEGFGIRSCSIFSLYKKESEDAVTDSSPQIPHLEGTKFLEISSTPNTVFSEPLVGHSTRKKSEIPREYVLHLATTAYHTAASEEHKYYIKFT